MAVGAASLATSLVAGAQDAKARISDGIVKIGVLTDINGPFMDNVGRGSSVATEIAVGAGLVALPLPGQRLLVVHPEGAASKANSVVIATAGLDLQNAIKQGKEFGLVEGGLCAL